ncbi:MAG: catalase [Ruminococcaceae bacterium]|nr:catalase [Oscillospiraceae bacterium]
MHFLAHLKTVGRHRRLVRKYCFRLGLYRQGLTHDLSKYSLTEFLVGVRYYQGDRSPNDAERREKGYSAAWLHHKGRNRHHLEYWTDYGRVGDRIGIVSVEMPVRYVAEMFCDRLAASHVYRGEAFRQEDPWIFFQRTKKNAVLHEKTQALLEEMLLKLRDEGEDAAFSYIRNEILRKGGDGCC